MIHFSTSRRLLATVCLLGFASHAFAMQDFTVSTTFQAGEEVAEADFVARLLACKTTMPVFLNSKPINLQIDCMKFFVSPTARCSNVTIPGNGVLSCTVDGSGGASVTILTSEFSFDCEGGSCPTTPAGLADCATPYTDIKFNGQCHASARCQYEAQGASFVDFGNFCPASNGDVCCGASSQVTRNLGYFPGILAAPAATADYLRDMGHVTDLSVRVSYDILPPALIKIEIDVPYVTSTSKVSYLENGILKDYNMCPSSYMIDFEDPVETKPLRDMTKLPNYISAPRDIIWTPLAFFPADDLLGRPRSSCGNYNFPDYSTNRQFTDSFGFPVSETDGGMSYGDTPVADSTVWDDTVSTQGIPSTLTNTKFWEKSAPNTTAGRITYTAGHFDLLKTFFKCKDYLSGQKVVSYKAEAESTFINGVPYPVETYEWTMSVCQVGYFGPNCRNAVQSVPQMYAKTCAKIPVSFSIAPQQVSHVTTSPVTSNIVSKTFLQSVKSFSGNCSPLQERMAITINLVFFTTEYSILEDTVHDILSPRDIFTVSSEQIDFGVSASALTSDAFIDTAPTQGVYKMDRITATADVNSVVYQKLVIITKCYNTGFDSVLGTRSQPDAFADAVAQKESDGTPTDRVSLDIELILRRETLIKNANVTNTLNIRILGTKETFKLKSKEALKQKDVTALQEIYTGYEVARNDKTPLMSMAISTLPLLDQTMFGGDQICSKHQIVGDDAQVAILTPNAVGSCMLSALGEGRTDALSMKLAGQTIQYQGDGMASPASYTFGCFNDWLDLSSKTPDASGVYQFASLVRTTNNHDSIFWFVQKEKLNQDLLPGNSERFHDRFGTGMFYFNSTSKTQIVSKSDQMQMTSASRGMVDADLTAGCTETSGDMKGACNLVCFDLANGLLTDPTGSRDRNVLVHHVSVATIASEDQTVTTNKFGPSATRRRLLESVAPFVPGLASQPSTTNAITVSPSRSQDGSTSTATTPPVSVMDPSSTPAPAPAPAIAEAMPIIGRDAEGKNGAVFWGVTISATLIVALCLGYAAMPPRKGK